MDVYFEFPTFPEANSFGVLEVYSPRMVSGVRYIVVLEGTVTGMYKEDEVHNEKRMVTHKTCFKNMAVGCWLLFRWCCYLLVN